MNRHRLLPLLALAVLAGCGGQAARTITSPSLSPPAAKLVQGHVCSPADEALQCVLPPSPPANAAPPPVTAFRGIQGEDFAWGAPSCATIRARGGSFGAGYIDHDTAKQWQQQAGLVASYHRGGCGTVMVWETSASRATQGFNAGVSDANEAAGQADHLGNTRDAIDFAVDCDCPGSQILGYFQGVHAILGSRTNAYGGYTQVAYLHQHGVVGNLNWQTYAWSGGRWLPASIAPLEQYQNGSAFDYDRALAANYGQWPAPVTCDTACQHRHRLELQRHWRARLASDVVLRDRIRQHLLIAGCRVVRPRSACRPLFAHGAAVNREIDALRRDLQHH